jgi:hypothetical protein
VIAPTFIIDLSVKKFFSEYSDQVKKYVNIILDQSKTFCVGRRKTSTDILFNGWPAPLPVER